MLKVGISRQEEVLNSYPHQLSGGMRQRVMIAMAISCSPKITNSWRTYYSIGCDYTGSNFRFIKEHSKDTQMSIILITHDLSVVSEFCDKVMVMYAGQIVEYGNLKEILENPKHPYTKNYWELFLH